MRVQIVHPLQKFQWEKGYTQALEGFDVTWTKSPLPVDGLAVFMWCDHRTIDFINNEPKRGKYIVFIRRYELYSMPLEYVDWGKVDAVVMVNDFLAEAFRARTGITPHIIYNAVTLEDWTFKERGHGKDIAWVGFVCQKKNLPLALQILAALPRDYRLHVAGAVQDMTTFHYCMNLSESLDLKVRFYGHVDNMDAWLDGKNYLLSTALSEGNPNNIIEACAKGIRPVVHEWPGAVEQFRNHTFRTVPEAVAKMSPVSWYYSNDYRALAEERFGPANYRRFRALVDEVLNG